LLPNLLPKLPTKLISLPIAFAIYINGVETVEGYAEVARLGKPSPSPALALRDCF
jgi:hypothetical protein